MGVRGVSRRKGNHKKNNVHLSTPRGLRMEKRPRGKLNWKNVLLGAGQKQRPGNPASTCCENKAVEESKKTPKDIQKWEKGEKKRGLHGKGFFRRKKKNDQGKITIS